MTEQNTRLILCTLPIGNLKDITKRALEHLKEAKVIFAEDTRELRKLLKLYEIDSQDKIIDSYHDHSSSFKLEKILKLLKSGKDVTIVSDAGSPIISDPAYPIIQEAYKEKILVDTMPGVSAFLTALELSGLPPTPFSFHGFFPRDNKKQKEKILEVSQSLQTHIFFESPHRIFKTIELFQKYSQGGEFAICRELTKMYQEVIKFDLVKGEEFDCDFKAVGEIVFLFYPNVMSHKSKNNELLEKLARDILEKGAKPKILSKLLSEILEENTSDIYSQLSKK